MSDRTKLIIAAAVITIAAGALRFYRLADQSFWTDEATSVMTARAPLDKISEYSSTLSNSLPTYFLLLRPLVHDSGPYVEFRARCLSAVAGALSAGMFVALVYCWQRSHKAAIFAGCLLGVNPLHIWYSQEARAYALMMLFGI